MGIQKVGEKMSLFRRLEILRVVSNPIRFAILLRLATGPKCFSRLAEEVYNEDIYMGRISGKFAYHLSVLRKARLIEPYKGKWRITPLGLKVLRVVDELIGGDSGREP